MCERKARRDGMSERRGHVKEVEDGERRGWHGWDEGWERKKKWKSECCILCQGQLVHTYMP